jgi:hypothetical protein
MKKFRRESDNLEVQDEKDRSLAEIQKLYGPGFVEVLPVVETEEKKEARRELSELKSSLSKSDFKILQKLEKLLPQDDPDVIARDAKRDRIRKIEEKL